MSPNNRGSVMTTHRFSARLTLSVVLPFFCLAAAPDPKIGAYYFDGWSGGTNSIHLTPRLQTEFEHRQPVWGWLANTPAIMQQQIDLAADHNISFWSFCWYYPEEARKDTPLNNALNLYLKSPNRSRLQFCLLVANHAGFRVGPNDWDTITTTWIDLFKQPTHLSIDGRPLIIFFSPRELIASFKTPAAVNKALQDFRIKAQHAGLKPPLVAACCTPGPEHGWNDLDELAAAGFELFTGYNYPGAGAIPNQKKQTFASLIAGHVGIYNMFARKNVRPYIPVVTTGWDMRPWEKPELPEQKMSVYYPDRTPTAVTQAIRAAIAWLGQNPDKTPKQRLILLYAWNENGEGGYLTPTKGDGESYLQAVPAALRP